MVCTPGGIDVWIQKQRARYVKRQRGDLDEGSFDARYKYVREEIENSCTLLPANTNSIEIFEVELRD